MNPVPYQYNFKQPDNSLVKLIGHLDVLTTVPHAESLPRAGELVPDAPYYLTILKPVVCCS